jgi:hypothetical protein
MHRTLKARLCRLERATAAKQTRPFGFVLRATDEADADREWAAIKASSALDGVEEPIPLVRVFIPEPAEPATAWRRRFNQIAGPHQLRCVPSSRSTLANSIATNAAACSFHFSVPSGAAFLRRIATRLDNSESKSAPDGSSAFRDSTCAEAARGRDCWRCRPKASRRMAKRVD